MSTITNEISDTTEMLARAWIECDPNRGGEPGSGFHADDLMEPTYSGSTDGELVEQSTTLTGKPRWHWFVPRAEALEAYLAERGYAVVMTGA